MKTSWPAVLACTAALTGPSFAAEVSLETAPPVIVSTVPTAGSTAVDPALKEIKAIFSKDMQDQSWSWSTWGEENFPEINGTIHYLADHRTCVAPVKLTPGKFYAIWLNSDKFHNFQDSDGRAAVPYLLTFRTRGAEKAEAAPAAPAAPVQTAALNEDQRAMEQWTDRQFRSFFDSRNFSGWSTEELSQLEQRLLDTLNGPRSREYYQAINTLGALRSTNAVQPLLAIASDRADKDCRDRWMAIRALGIIGDRSVVPELIHLVYHGNVNTRWWAQISLVRLTGANFGGDWKAWGDWWTRQAGQPPFRAEFVQWSSDPRFADPETLKQTLNESDQKFFASIRPKS